MQPVLKQAVTGALERSGAVGLMRRWGPEQPMVLALVYHRIAEQHDPFFPSVDARTFEAHLGYLKQHYQAVSLQTFTHALAGEAELPRRSAFITIDGGYEETLTVAQPILARCEMPAVAFLVTGCIGTGVPLWSDELAVWIKTTGRVHCRLSINGHEAEWHLGSVAARLACLSALRQWLRGLPDEERRTAMRELAKYLHVNGQALSMPPMLTWEQVKMLRAGGLVSIGAQTRTAPILSRVSPELAWYEIHGAKRDIEERLGEPVTSFAYPSGRPGDVTAPVEEAVRRAGYTTAWTTLYGSNTLRSNPWRLMRIQTSQRHMPSFGVQLVRLGMER